MEPWPFLYVALKQSVTGLVSDETKYNVIKRQLSICLDNAPKGCNRPEITDSCDDDRLAAVLVPLIWQNSDWQILMTKRAAHLAHHAGQISFLEGVLDASDKGLINTALREAYEEISLTPTSVKIMDSLQLVRSPAGLVVQPFVGIIGGDCFFELQPNPAEIDSIFTLPLAHIGQPDNFYLVPRRADGYDKSYWVVAHSTYYIWGLSASVLHGLRQRLFHGPTLP